MEAAQKPVESASSIDHTLSEVHSRGGITSHRTHSVYHLDRAQENSQVVAPSPFSPEGYSLFKHGDERWTRRYGHEVADWILEAESELFDNISSDEVLIASFPDKYVPTAATLMTEHAIMRLNHKLSSQRKPTVGCVQVFKYLWQASGEHYFAHMKEADRRRILDNVKLSVDERRLRDAHLIIVDDIRVTGATEDKFLELLYRVDELRSLTVVYLAEVDPAIATVDPAIEGRLNQHKVKNISDVAAIVATGEFQWNIRVAKFVLEADDLQEFSAFVDGLSNELLLTFYKMTTLNDYHLEPNYARQFQVIHTAVEDRKLV